MTPDCERVLSHLGEKLSGELLAHAQNCAECQKVQESYRLLEEHKGAPAHSARDLGLPAAAALELRKHPHARPWWWGTVVLALIYLALVLLAVAVLGPPRRVAVPPQVALRAIGIGLALLSTVGFLAALSPRARAARTALFLLLGFLLLGILAFAPSTDEAGPFLAEGVPCLTVEVVMSLLPIGLGIWLLTRSAFHPIRSLLLLFCAATAGLVVLCFHCSNGQLAHLLVFHLAPWLALGVLAWAVRAKARSHSFAP
jgi:hypothetical protein